jgi:D-glycero-alpha-D-manno-heptose 1-phosphate guanylyltransferase
MIRTAIILAGGFGTRLKTVVSDLPKPMAPVNGQPFLNYQFRYLEHFGIKNVILSTGHLADKIKDHYKNKFEGLNILYSHENSPLGTGGGIRLAMEHTREKEIIVLNGDSFFDVNLNYFFQKHKENSSQVSIALRMVSNASRYGRIEIDQQNRIVSFLEKSSEESAGLINGGVYILERELFIGQTKGGTNFSIEKDFFQANTGKIKMMGFPFEGYFIDIGIPEDYTKAQNDLKGFKY